MLKLLVAGSVLAASGAAAEQDLAKIQGSSFKVDTLDSNVAGTQEDSASPIGVTGTPSTKLHAALFHLMEAMDKYDAKSAAAGYKTSSSRALIPKLADELSELFAPDVTYMDIGTDNPLQQYIAWGGKMDYSEDKLQGAAAVSKGMAAWFLDMGTNPLMTNVGPNQVSNIDYGKAAGVSYLVATAENIKPLALKDLYVDFSLSLDGEEFYYQIYQLALAVNEEGKITAIAVTNGRDMKSLMQDKLLPKLIAAAKKTEMSASELVEVRRSYAQLAERRAKQRAQLNLAEKPAAVEFPVSGMSALFFAAGLFSSLLGVTFVGSRFTASQRTVNVGNPLLGEP